MSLDMNKVVLSVRDLSVSYQARRGRVRAVSRVSFDLHAGETLALIGESGCGKSTLNLALIRQLPKNASIDSGSIAYTYRDGRTINLLDFDKTAMRRYLWSECSMVFQGALNSLNPVLRVSDLVYETAAAHGIGRLEALTRALTLFEQVRLDAKRVFNSYPHEMSGGMRQRVLLALSLLLRPQIVIMDEPTTAVDILTQRSILDVLKQLRAELNFSVIFISHDLAVAAEIADTVATMYAGEIVEIGPVNDVFYRSRHAYTLSLLNAAPRLSAGAETLESIPGSPPDLIEPPPGCKFHERCAYVQPICRTTPPPMVAYDSGAGRAACHETARVLADARQKV
ncbi:MAG: ABC transporter ATP-binding protein [Anaerolineae bacterium]|nr:ABC transporter ATP-binding protein [Anaerolineae bacterium]